MARPTRPDQVIRCVLLALAMLCGRAGQARAGLFGGKSFTMVVPKGWTTRPGFASAELLVTSPGNGANLNVVVSPAPNQSLDAASREITTSVKLLKNFKLYGNNITALDGVLALAFEYAYDDAARGRLRVRQVLAIRNKKTVVVTCITKAAAWPRIWPAFSGMLATFHFKKNKP